MSDTTSDDLRAKGDKLFSHQYPRVGRDSGNEQIIDELEAGNARRLRIARRRRGGIDHDVVLRFFQVAPDGTEVFPLTYGLHFSTQLLPAFAHSIARLLDLEIAEKEKARGTSPASHAEGNGAAASASGGDGHNGMERGG